ncbi:MAG: hypothetical protein P9E24_01175 [Candidatus Competibacter sp.]|nr:hypothetical protein [Candidatus Competibacter sp.]MDG4583363.1 hypothetical protein [Candidatus Competibacter sp.]
MQKPISLLLFIAISTAFAQAPPILVPVDDVTRLVSPANRTPSPRTLPHAPASPRLTAPAQNQKSGMTPEEVEMFRKAEERGRRQALEQSKTQTSISPDKKESCRKIGLFAKSIAEARQKGVPLHVAEAGVGVILGKHTTPDGLKFAKDVVRSVYANKLTTENASEITAASCEVMVFVGTLMESDNK